MQTARPTAATLLLLFYLTTRPAPTNGNTVRSWRSVPSASDQIALNDTTAINDGNDERSAKFPTILNPGKINSEILSLVDNKSDDSGKNIVPPSTDQQVDQSEMRIVMADDTLDPESMEHALSVVEYEPQKINKKTKRKTIKDLSINSGSVVPIVESATLSIDTAYYEVPRTKQPKKLSLQYHFKPSYESQNPLEIDPKLTPRDVQYSYVAPVLDKAIKQRNFKDRASVNPQTTPLIEEPKLKNVLPSKIPAVYRYSSLTGDQRRPTKPLVESTITTTPSNGDSYSTKAPRRRKSRKRVAERTWNRRDTVNSENDDNSYVSDAPKVHRAVNLEGRNKSRYLGSVGKQGVASKTLARSVKPSQKTRVERLTDESAALSGNRESNNRNPHPKASRSNDGESSGHFRVTEPVGSLSSGLNRKLYERHDNKKSSSEQTPVNNGPLPYIEKPNSLEYSETVTGRPLSTYKTGLPEERSPKLKTSGYANDLESGSKVSSVDIYQTIRAPGAGLESPSSVSSTVLPLASSNSYSSNLVLYPPETTTLAPVQSHEATWTPQGEQNHQDRDLGFSEKGQKREAEAANYGSNEDESKSQGGVEIPDSSDGGHQGGPGDQDQHDQSAHGSGEDHDQYDGKRYDQWKDEVHGDSSHESSQKSQRHQDMNEDADKEGGGGDVKFEKGEGTEHAEGHQETEGDKGEKAYKSWHGHEKANKGFSDKERKSNYYDEKDGKEKEHKDEGGYHEEHQHGEKGEKQAEFDEKGQHQKGYNTKGQHSVHKKDEFEKRTEFFDEFHEDGEQEKDGEYYEEHENKKGGHEKVSHYKEGDLEEKYGKEAEYMKGKHYHEDKGHKVNEGKENHYEHDDMHGKKNEHKDRKKWEYKKGDDGNAGGKDEKSAH